LPRLVYECLEKKSIVEGSEDDLMAVGRGLKCHEDESKLTPQLVLDVLTKSLDSIDGNGNALLESPTLFKGSSVKAVHSSTGEVYLKNLKEENAPNEYNNPEEISLAEGYNEYQTIQNHIKYGLSLQVEDATNTDTSTDGNGDKVALEKWKQDMRGSALAGFHLAMRAGPLCEEPVRGVAVVLEYVEIAVTQKSSGEYVAAPDVTGGMVVAALRSGIRCALM
jgi:translation elongation factor EF-G